MIDSPVYPEELRALPGVLEQAGFPVSGLLATHGDWDHLLGRLAFPDAALGAGESTVARLESELGQAHRELRAVRRGAVRRPSGRRSSLGSLQALPVPGRLSSAPGRARHELELYPTGGHTADGTAFWLPWAHVLVCGDYLSPVEMPMISPGGSPLDLPRDARPLSGAGRRRPSGSSPATAGRSPASAPRRCWPRTAPTSTRSPGMATRRRCRRAAHRRPATAARRERGAGSPMTAGRRRVKTRLRAARRRPTVERAR